MAKNTSPVWETNRYYDIAKQASETKHPGFSAIAKVAKQSKKILEVGCGEGTKLNQIVPSGAEGVGVDISSTAIAYAQKQYPAHRFIEADACSLPFKDHSFDLVYSTFFMEHTTQPNKILREMRRVLKPHGYLALLTPNFGAPHRASPCFKGSRLQKLVNGILNDLKLYFNFGGGKQLSWKHVKPIATKDSYEIDWDTTVEPYLLSTLMYLEHLGFTISKKSSFWNVPEPKEHVMNKLFRFWGWAEIFPFSYWGPHFLVIAQKTDIKTSKFLTVLELILPWIKAVFWIIVFVLPFTPILIAIFLLIQNVFKRMFKL